MAEITYQMVLSTLQTVGLLVGIFYYIMTLNNTRKNQELTLQSQELTRKAQEHATESRQIDIFMRWQIIQTDPEWMQNYIEVLTMEWEDFDDFARKYSHSENPKSAGKRFAAWTYWNGLGYLLSRGEIDSETMYDMRGNESIVYWNKFEPIVRGFRERDGRPENWRWFEYLADEMKKVRNQRGMGEYTTSWQPTNP